mgnify:CR=1 FL=1
MKKVYLKYKTQLDNAYNDRALSGLNSADLMIILRATEKELGKDIPITMSCPSCVMSLIDLFMNLVKNKK